MCVVANPLVIISLVITVYEVILLAVVAYSHVDPHLKGVLEYSGIRVQGLCVLCYVHPYGGTGVRAFMHEPHIRFFMRCRIDIVELCIRTSWSTAGILFTSLIID